MTGSLNFVNVGNREVPFKTPTCPESKMLAAILLIGPHLEQTTTALAVIKKIKSTEFGRFAPKHRSSPYGDCVHRPFPSTLLLHEFLERHIIVLGTPWILNIYGMAELFEPISDPNNIRNVFFAPLGIFSS